MALLNVGYITEQYVDLVFSSNNYRPDLLNRLELIQSADRVSHSTFLQTPTGQIDIILR